MSDELDLMMDVFAWAAYLSFSIAAVCHKQFINNKRKALADTAVAEDSNTLVNEAAGAIPYSGVALIGIGLLQLLATGAYLAQDVSEPWNIVAAVASLVVAGIIYKISMVHKELAAVSCIEAERNTSQIAEKNSQFQTLFHCGAHLALVAFAAYDETSGHHNALGIFVAGVAAYWAIFRYKQNKLAAETPPSKDSKKWAADKGVWSLVFLAVVGVLWGGAIEQVLKDYLEHGNDSQPEPIDPDLSEEPQASSAFMSFFASPAEKQMPPMEQRLAMA